MYAVLGFGFAAAAWRGAVPDRILVRCWLTGAADGLPDIELPIAGFYARMYSGQASAFQVSVPYTEARYAAVKARAQGDLFVERVTSRDGVELGAESLFSFPNTGRQLHQGPYRQTLVLSGERQTTNATPATHSGLRFSLAGLDFNGARTWTTDLATVVRPGDAIVVEGEIVTIDRVQAEADTTRAKLTLRAGA